MDTVMDGVQNALPRSAVHDFHIGTGLFTGMRHAEIMADNGGSGEFKFSANKKITFQLSSPSKFEMIDLRSHFIKFDLELEDSKGGQDGCSIAEPIESIINQVVIRAGDVVVN